MPSDRRAPAWVRWAHGAPGAPWAVWAQGPLGHQGPHGPLGPHGPNAPYGPYGPISNLSSELCRVFYLTGHSHIYVCTCNCICCLLRQIILTGRCCTLGFYGFRVGQNRTAHSYPSKGLLRIATISKVFWSRAGNIYGNILFMIILCHFSDFVFYWCWGCFI